MAPSQYGVPAAPTDPSQYGAPAAPTAASQYGGPAAPTAAFQYGGPVAPTAASQFGGPVGPGTMVQPGYPGAPIYSGGPPRKPGRSKTIWGIAGAALILVVVVIVVIAVSAHGNNTTPAADGNPTTGTSTQQPTPSATASPASSPSAGSTSAATGSGYTAYQFTDTADNNYVYKVALVTIDENASDSVDTPDPGTHFVGVEFSILGVSGNDDDNDDAFNCSSVQGSDGKTYNGVFAQINDGSSFDSGAFGPAPGTTVTGWIPFELPNGVTVVSVQWQDDEPTEPVLWKVH